MTFKALPVQGDTIPAVVYAARCEVPGASFSQGYDCLRIVDEMLDGQRAELICGGDSPEAVVEKFTRRAYRTAKRRGLARSGILGWLIGSPIIWQLLAALISHWFSRGGGWFSKSGDDVTWTQRPSVHSMT